MRHLSSLLLSATAVLGANAFDASIFTFDSNRQAQHLKDPSVLDDVAPSLLALRTNSDDGLALERSDQETVGALNQLGGMPAPLFGEFGDSGNQGRYLIILEGVNQELGSSMRRQYPGNLASSFSASALGDDPLAFIRETQSSRGSGAGDKHCAFAVDEDMSDTRANEVSECLSQPIREELLFATNNEFLDHVNFIETWTSKSRSTSSLRASFKPGCKLPKENLKSLFDKVSAFSRKGRDATMVLLPNPRTSAQPSRHSTRSSMKGETLTKAGHTKREGSDVLPSLSLPVCHSSNSSCAESTNNCSGHGFCFKKYATKGDEAYNECYACKCQETVEKKEDGTTRKVRWGGPACQKQDLSSPFWLLAGITIMVVGAAAAAVGMLFNVGQEELPGVISAGVGAPRGQK